MSTVFRAATATKEEPMDVVSDLASTTIGGFQTPASQAPPGRYVKPTAIFSQMDVMRILFDKAEPPNIAEYEFPALKIAVDVPPPLDRSEQAPSR